MLNTAIDLAYGQIRTYGAVYSNESNVEDQLIPPILHALGWDTGDPEHVQTKIGVRGNSKLRPDFILFKERQYFAFIEAKRLGNVSPKDHKEKLMDYMKYSNNVILTDGLRWSGYTDSSLDPIWMFNIARTPVSYCIQLFLALHPSVVSIEESVKMARAIADSYIDDFISDKLHENLQTVDLKDVLVDYLTDKVTPACRCLDMGLDRMRVQDYLVNLGEYDIDEKLREWASELEQEE